MNKIIEDVKRPYLKAFFTAFILFLLSTIPVLIMSGGIYIFISDYNDQTIPFTEHTNILFHSASGLPTFDMQSDLGLDYIVNYGGFIFSPFAWLLILAPIKAVPYLHTVVIGIKIGFAAVSSMLWFRQYLKKSSSAYICAMLYAFSGFQLFNLIYQFADAYALFPLLIYAFDKLVTEKKPVGFALMLAINGFTNYFFLWEECVFLLIYFIVRTATKTFPRITVRSFIQLALETLCGVFMASALMVPTAYSLLTNKRAGSLIFKNDLLAYDYGGIIPRIIQSLFLPPEMIRGGWYFNNSSDLSFSAPALYIPLFSIIGVYCIMKQNKKSWYSIILIISSVIACVPVLNSVFAMMNSTYYSRWYFMPLTVMILMTGMFIDDIDSFDPMPAIKINFLALCILIPIGLYNIFVNDINTESLNINLWIYAVAVAVIGLVYLFLMFKPIKGLNFINKKNLPRAVCILCFASFLFRYYAVAGKDFHMHISNHKLSLYNNFQPVELDDDEFFRISGSGYQFNTGLTWGYPTPEYFSSMITGEETSFYSHTGIYRSQGIWTDATDYALYTFLSVKYDFYLNKPLPGNIPVEPQDVENSLYVRTGYVEPSVHGGYIIHKNSAYIPMGFTYDHYIDIDEITPFNESDMEDNDDNLDKYVKQENEEIVSEEKSEKEGIVKDKQSTENPNQMSRVYENEKLLLKAIWLTDEQIEKYGDILTELPDEEREDFSLAAYYEDSAKRAATSCYEFEPTNDGFSAKTKLDKDNLVFFSVPYSEGFTAYVDGKETEIEKVFGGLMAVYVPEGDHSIDFKYETPGLKLGIAISCACAGIIAVYGIIFTVVTKKTGKKEQQSN